MKRILIILILSAITILMNSCDSGCNCPGGAGYSQNKTQTYTQHT